MHIIIFILLMALAAPGAFAENAQKNIERQCTEWLNAKVPEGINPADLSPDQLEHFFFQKGKNVNRWFSAQGDTLLKSLLTAFVSAAVIALGGYVSGRLLRKKKRTAASSAAPRSARRAQCTVLSRTRRDSALLFLLPDPCELRTNRFSV